MRVVGAGAGSRSSLRSGRTGLRVGVNALFLIPGGVGGTEIYLRSLLEALGHIDQENQYIIFTNRETGRDLVPHMPNFSNDPQPVWAMSRPARIVWEQSGLPLRAVHMKLDVMLNPGYTAPLLSPCPQVTVFHDLQHKRHPQNYRWWELPVYQGLLYWSARGSRRLLADSEATASDLQRYYRVPASKVSVALLGVDQAFARVARRRRPERFLLAVSTLHPHKNLANLLRAFAAFRPAHPEFRLIVCGIHGFVSGPLHELRDSLGLGDAVDFPGWIPRAELYELYARAWAFVYPTLFEGFGLPLVEAMAAGLPTACSSIEPLTSIAGGAALQFDPQDVGDLATALARITDDDELRTKFSVEGPRQAAKFSWESTAKVTLGALSEACRPDHRRAHVS